MARHGCNVGGSTITTVECQVPMPTVLRYWSYRVFFFSNESSEPPHVHVESGDGYAKFWLEPVAAVTWVGFGPRDLRRIQRILNLHKADILEQWHEHRARQDQ